MIVENTKLRSGKFMVPVKMVRANGRIFFKFGFNRTLMAEIKAMKGRQWHCYDGAPLRDLVKSMMGTDKIWSVLDCDRNNFQIKVLQGKKPYKPWLDAINNRLDLEFERPLREHQIDLVQHGLQAHYGIWAAEMGTGKTLSIIEVMERSDASDWWYVAPKSALRAVSHELIKWNCTVTPQLMTYEAAVRKVREWRDGDIAPQGLILDESQKVKNYKAQRSEAALALADGVRSDHGDDGYVILMSGSPAPKAPTDWWHQCEIACPGYLREGTVNAFQFRLGLFEEQESMAGGKFQKRITWLDDEQKCAICGNPENHMVHDFEINDPRFRVHEFKPSVNEVAKLYRRMRGLVVVKFKKDCLDLPDKQYRVIKANPTSSIVRAAKLVAANATTVASALTKLRELSDGFQYREEITGSETCDLCGGSGEMDDFTIKPEYADYYEEHGVPEADYEGGFVGSEEYLEKYFDVGKTTCTSCGGHGEVPTYSRVIDSVPCPKDDVLRDVLDEHDDVGRLVVYSGFEGSIDRIVKTCLASRWAVIKWDGKGIKVWGNDGVVLPTLNDAPTNTVLPDGVQEEGTGAVEPITMFQRGQEEFPRVVFVANAGAAGTGLTLTASPSILYYSNSFNAEDRIQSEDRIHRMGMAENKGATIIDIVHLPTDEYVLKNLKEKRKLQDMTMGDLREVFEDPKQLLDV